MSRNRNKFPDAAPILHRFIVTGETGSIYLAQENRYPAKGEVIQLSQERADVLLSANLIAVYEDAQEENINKE